ncbi:hypothetical protein TIFTF001_013567 [Ficus carica]|uniref:Dof zinc finger protein n=1 Tax=Ficus carica TaxID=3494 RepID=A0AA88A297_FICCA|nr:hypothetical protein TIFTF001_013567 [Ficus carica]
MDQGSSKQQAPNNNMTERRATRPQKDQALNCPRCNSTNTKFCYYNNYSLTQPRYFCKTCRRYWTEGGSLRNVPVGGGSRKNKRSSSTSSSSSTISSSSSPSSNLPISKLSHPHHQTVPVEPSFNFPPKIHQGQDLNLAYPPSSSHHDHQNNISRSSFVEAPYNSTATESYTPNPSSTGTATTSAMELLKTGTTHGLISSFMSMPVVVDQDSNTMLISSGLIPNLAQEFKPSLSFGLHHAGYSNNHDHHHRQGYDHHRNLDQHHHAVQDQTGARLLFPSDRRQELKHVSSTTSTASDHDQRQDHHDHHQFELNKGQGDISNGYTWNGMLGHGGSW